MNKKRLITSFIIMGLVFNMTSLRAQDVTKDQWELGPSLATQYAILGIGIDGVYKPKAAKELGFHFNAGLSIVTDSVEIGVRLYPNISKYVSPYLALGGHMFRYPSLRFNDSGTVVEYGPTAKLGLDVPINRKKLVFNIEAGPSFLFKDGTHNHIFPLLMTSVRVVL